MSLTHEVDRLEREDVNHWRTKSAYKALMEKDNAIGKLQKHKQISLIEVKNLKWGKRN
jgi:hypothetical protein